ncbi:MULTISPECIES: molybdate ABC transporter substrate-binding protein [Pseudanabaena]|uniref:Molybdenum ABC transporter, periplasmic molybdate-binding protein n=2 Tax=Pseudanabaena TaxID=1152 RepID=L8MX98_9CYAN|nr:MULTISPECIES: molybdate ABC transporter substrate-binding protein [Pseudanabaena]ELS31424.1 molybdenum ABC transporter, periplasmic molybdate-binding protein [Pseudanabaena biceps PCC 7429]MDG3496321.1 molybdate ABC transporter substrate-binding protein [Pseudanabaena catenata USMAC16]
MNKKKVITFLSLIVVTLSTIVGCSFFSPTTEQTNKPVASQESIQPANSNQENAQLTVSAAVSLKDVLNEITPLYNQVKTNVSVRTNFANGGNIQQQVMNGAPVDVLIPGAAKQMDELQKRDLIVTDTRRDLLSNRIVLIVPLDKGDISDLKDLTKADFERIAIGDPRSVPAGQYAEQALKKLELLPDLQSKFVLGNNVRQVLQFVESGNAQAGFVFATDAKASTKVKVVQVIDAKLHESIVYPIAVVRKSANQSIAKSYLDFLSTETAKTIFEKYGFSSL